MAIDDGPKSALPGVIRPIIRVRLVTRARAAGEGVYRSCLIACSTRWRVAGRTPGTSLRTRDTVWCETLARRATSKMLPASAGRSSALTAGSASSEPVPRLCTFGRGVARFSVVGLGARHHREQGLEAHVVRVEGGDDLAVAQNDDPVTDAQDLLEFRRDEEHGHPRFGQLAHQPLDL